MLKAAILCALSVVAAETDVELLEFTAPYCAGCRQMEPTVRRLSAEGLPIRQIDVQADPARGQQFGVHSIPCFISVVGGKVLERREGAQTEPDLRAMLDRARRSADGMDVRGPSAPVTSDQQKSTSTPNIPPLAPWNRPSSTPAAVVPHLNPDLPSARLASIDQPAEPVSVGNAAKYAVRIKIVDDHGQSLGSGTIIDVHEDEALVLTCGHIFRDSEGKGKILCDLFVANRPRELAGKLIAYDLRRDIGFISVRPGIAVQAAPVGGDGHFVREGDGVFAVGCSRGEDPTVIENRVIAVNRYHGPANLVVGGRPVDGRSGGGLFDRNGVLIGVCNAADQEADEGLYAALGPIHAELDQAGLSYIFRPEVPAIASRPKDKQSQWVPPRAMSQLDDWPRPPRLPGSRTPASAAAEPQLASQVILILRDREHPEKPGQVYVLDRPSEATLGVLSQELARRGPLAPTGLDQLSPPSPQSPTDSRRYDPAGCAVAPGPCVLPSP